jgi:hypothetical protein
MQAKFVYESIGDVFKSKSEDQIIKDFGGKSMVLIKVKFVLKKYM